MSYQGARTTRICNHCHERFEYVTPHFYDLYPNRCPDCSKKGHGDLLGAMPDCRGCDEDRAVFESMMERCCKPAAPGGKT